MAAASDESNEVLYIFSHLNRFEMTLIELHKNLSTRFPQITMDEVLRIIRKPNLINLFNLQPISNDLCLVQLSPKLTLCEACLQKSCKNKGTCTKLHLCRYASHFTNKPVEKPCSFPHRLSEYPHNLILLQQYNYDSLNEDLLLNLLRLHYSQTQNDRAHLNKSRPPSQVKKSPVPSENIAERQMDISIPSERDATDVDLEIVQLLLATKDIIIERILDKQFSNEFYQRFTIQFSNKQIIDHLLATEPIIVYNNIPIKMKRTQRQRDTKIFALKFPTNQKLDNIRLNLYVETLVGKVHPSIFDMTPDRNDEQIYLIRCEQSIDFNHMYKVHSAKNTLQGHRVIIAEVYETETLAISLKRRSLSLTIPRLRQLFGEKRWSQDVFACLSIRDQTSAEIELMNAEITAQWLSEADRFERELSISINPVIDFIQSDDKNNEEDDEEITNLLPKSKASPLNVPDDLQKDENEPTVYTVKQDWRIVLTHPIFGDEYRKYIRENLNISAQITGSSISVPNEHIRKELARYTNMFIQRFVFRDVSNLDKSQVKMIKDNYSRMAHKWQKDSNKTLLAAHRDVMNELFPRVSSSTNRQPSRTTTTPIPKKSSPIILEESIQPKTTEDNFYTLPYSIENSVYFPFFKSPNSFSARLHTYLSDTFNIKLDVKKTSTTKYVLELKGQRKDVSDARPALTSLFASLKTKTYTDTNDSCKFIIPDVFRVVQWNLDQCLIVSSCSFSPINGGTLLVRYFADNPQFGTDEQKLDDVILNQLIDKSHQVSITSKNLENKLQELENRIQRRSEYAQDICCLYDHQKDLPTIYLYGIKPIVQQISQDIKKIFEEHTPISCRIELQPNEIEYLLKICLNDLIKIEKKYENEGVDLRSKLKSEPSEFLAPKYLHEKMKLSILEMSRIQTISKDIKCSVELIKSKKQEFNNLASKNRCLIKITILSPPPSTARSTAPSDPKISSGSIHISSGDLTTEPADVLVVCSTSQQLRTIMIKSAGPQVEQELAGKDLTKSSIATSAGQLKQAKRLVFLPWAPPAAYINNQDMNALQQSIASFVRPAIKYTIQEKFKSIAFPAIGCGGFGINSDVIATILIDAVREQLALNPTVQLTVTFVVQQPHVYDSFKAKLKPSLSTAATRTRSPSPLRSNNLEKVNIILTTANSNIEIAKQLLKQYQDILNS